MSIRKFVFKKNSTKTFGSGYIVFFSLKVGANKEGQTVRGKPRMVCLSLFNSF